MVWTGREHSVGVEVGARRDGFGDILSDVINLWVIVRNAWISGFPTSLF